MIAMLLMKITCHPNINKKIQEIIELNCVFILVTLGAITIMKWFKFLDGKKNYIKRNRQKGQQSISNRRLLLILLLSRTIKFSPMPSS